MSQSVILPSTLASPTRVFLSPFPPPNEQQQKKATKGETIANQQKKHSICPYKISTDLARTKTLTSLPPKRSTSLIKSCDDYVLLDKYALSPISTYSSCGDDDDEDYYDDDYEDDYDFISLYYYNRHAQSDTADGDTNDCPLSSYFSSTSSSASSSSSLTMSPPSRIPMRTSVSTPLLKTRQSTPVHSTARLPKWIKHVSQTPSLLEKKISRGFPFRSTVPVPLRMDMTTVAVATTKALYCGSPLIRQYLKSATKAERFDDMLRFGFPCPNALIQQEQDNGDPILSKVKKQQCPTTCHQCGGQQRLMTLRVTLTPLHARANENDIYKSNTKRSRKIRHTTHPTIIAPSPV